MAILFTFRVFGQKSAERKSPKEYFFYISFCWRCLIWSGVWTAVVSRLINQHTTQQYYGDFTKQNMKGNIEYTILLWLQPFSRFLVKTLRVNKIAMKSFLKICRLKSTHILGHHLTFFFSTSAFSVNFNT